MPPTLSLILMDEINENQYNDQNANNDPHHAQDNNGQPTGNPD